jgi:hypothetical protein
MPTAWRALFLVLLLWSGIGGARHYDLASVARRAAESNRSAFVPFSVQPLRLASGKEGTPTPQGITQSWSFGANGLRTLRWRRTQEHTLNDSSPESLALHLEFVVRPQPTRSSGESASSTMDQKATFRVLHWLGSEGVALSDRIRWMESGVVYPCPVGVPGASPCLIVRLPPVVDGDYGLSVAVVAVANDVEWSDPEEGTATVSSPEPQGTDGNTAVSNSVQLDGFLIQSIRLSVQGTGVTLEGVELSDSAPDTFVVGHPYTLSGRLWLGSASHSPLSASTLLAAVSGEGTPLRFRSGISAFRTPLEGGAVEIMALVGRGIEQERVPLAIARVEASSFVTKPLRWEGFSIGWAAANGADDGGPSRQNIGLFAMAGGWMSPPKAVAVHSCPPSSGRLIFPPHPLLPMLRHEALNLTMAIQPQAYLSQLECDVTGGTGCRSPRWQAALRPLPSFCRFHRHAVYAEWNPRDPCFVRCMIPLDRAPYPLLEVPVQLWEPVYPTRSEAGSFQLSSSGRWPYARRNVTVLRLVGLGG